MLVYKGQKMNPSMEEVAHTWAKVLDLNNEKGDRYIIGVADGARFFGKWLDEQLCKPKGKNDVSCL